MAVNRCFGGLGWLFRNPFYDLSHILTCMKDDANARADVELYLPGMPSLSAQVGRVESAIKSLFRRRGGLRVRFSR
ncbi:MAG: hypothetical protein A07HR60_00418 [uncultured archaeon A07HR60]|nr:MAG: hypothetical protein A07HR60_00418 [uncultured archaeon A07HR60]